MSNFEAALKAEMKRVVRRFQMYDYETRANLEAARVRYSSPTGEFYYVHPDVPGVCFPKRNLAARAALARQ